MLYKARKSVIELFNDYSSIASEANLKATKWTELEILTPKQMLQRLSIAYAQVKASKNSKNLLSEIRQIVYSL